GYETHPLPIATNHKLPCVSNEPPSRNLPCGVALTSANFSTGPTPCGKGGSPQGWIGTAGAGCACAAVGPGAAVGQTSAKSATARVSIGTRRNRMAQTPRGISLGGPDGRFATI